MHCHSMLLMEVSKICHIAFDMSRATQKLIAKARPLGNVVGDLSFQALGLLQDGHCNQTTASKERNSNGFCGILPLIAWRSVDFQRAKNLLWSCVGICSCLLRMTDYMIQIVVGCSVRKLCFLNKSCVCSCWCWCTIWSCGLYLFRLAINYLYRLQIQSGRQHSMNVSNASSEFYSNSNVNAHQPCHCSYLTFLSPRTGCSLSNTCIITVLTVL